MANSQFPLRIGAKNGSNGGVIRALKNNRLPHAYAPRFWWYQKFDILRAGTLDADGAQTFNLHTYNPYNLFPANVIRSTPSLYVGELVAGGAISAATLSMGDDDVDGLHTAVDVFTGAALGYRANTVGAAEYAPRFEAAFVPTFTVTTTTGNVNAATSGEFWAMIGFTPVPGVS